MRFHSLFLHYLLTTRPLGYFLIFLGMILEGDAVIFTALFLTNQGFFDLGDVLLAILAGVLSGDLLWYWLGSRLKDSFSSLARRAERLTKSADQHLLERTGHTIFASKFAYGLHHAILIRAGMLNLNLKKFIKTDFLASLLWISIVGSLGYFSSASLAVLRPYLRFAEISLALGLVIFFFLWRFISRGSREVL